MKQFIYVFILCLCSLPVFSQKWECNVTTFLDPEFKGEIAVYENYSKEKILGYLKNDESNENIISFQIKKQINDMIYVQAFDLYNTVNIAGWIQFNNYIGIYSRAYQGNLKLYKSPNIESDINCIIKEYDPEVYTVIGCCKDWLKVKRILHGKTYIGWMSPEMQCANPYSTCS